MSEIKKIVIFKEFNMKNNILLSAILAGMISIPLSGVYAASGDSNFKQKKAALAIAQKRADAIGLNDKEKVALKTLVDTISSNKDMRTALEKIAKVKKNAGGDIRDPKRDNGFNLFPKEVVMKNLIGKE